MAPLLTSLVDIIARPAFNVPLPAPLPVTSLVDLIERITTPGTYFLYSLRSVYGIEFFTVRPTEFRECVMRREIQFVVLI